MLLSFMSLALLLYDASLLLGLPILFCDKKSASYQNHRFTFFMLGYLALLLFV